MNKNIQGDFQICISVPLTYPLMRINKLLLRDKPVQYSKRLRTGPVWLLCVYYKQMFQFSVYVIG